MIENKPAVNIWPAKYGPLMKVVGISVPLRMFIREISDANERSMPRYTIFLNLPMPDMPPHGTGYWSFTKKDTIESFN